MVEAEALLEQIRARGARVWLDGPQPEAAIATLEQALGVGLPGGFRAFLSRFGGLGIGDSFISGIIDGKPLAEEAGSLYGDTLRFREEWSLPAHLLVVQADEDAPYCLDSGEHGSAGECPVVCFELHSRRQSRLANSFRDWFIEWLRLRAERGA